MIFCVAQKVISMALNQTEEMFGCFIDNPFRFAFNISVTLVNLIVFILAFLTYTHVCISAAALGLILNILVILRVNCNAKWFNRNLYGRFSWHYIVRYIVHDIKTVQFVFTCNNIFGPLLLAFLVVNIPISAYVIVLLALGISPNIQSTIILAAFPAHELLCCVVIHWFSAKLNASLHKSSKRLLNAMATNAHRVGDFRARFWLEQTIARQLTKQKHGITYGFIELVTMASFGKVGNNEIKSKILNIFYIIQCMLLYCEFLMYSYKLIKDF